MLQPDVGHITDPYLIRKADFQVFDQVAIAWIGVLACVGAGKGQIVSFPSALRSSASGLTKCGAWLTTHPQIEMHPEFT